MSVSACVLVMSSLAVGAAPAGQGPSDQGSAVQSPASHGSAEQAPAPGLQILREHCSGCHQQSTPDHFARISEIRKTPEGWLMTIFRMQHVHQVQMTDDDRSTLIRYLADTQGLAPSETTPARYALERRPNVQDMTLPGELQTLCARCHSAARIALQRRDADDWLKHVHWHLAQWPTIEYHQNARDRYWWQTASTVAPTELGKLFPLHTQAWADWQKHARPAPEGRWLVRGHEPGRGDYWGVAVISRTGDGEYAATYSLDTDAGMHVAGDSKAIVYTGFEWRGTAQLSGRDIHEVYALSEDGRTLSGRWFETAHSEIGSDWTAVRAGGQQILAVVPAAARAGTTRRVTVVGSGLEGAVSFGKGIKTRVLARTADSLTVELEVPPGAARGYREVTVGKTHADRLFAIYDHIDRLDVTPAFGIARVGGGKIDAVAAQFEAVAYIDVPGADGKAEAIRLGTPAVTWRAEPFNDEAKAAEDEKFAGHIDSNGRFLPAGAGPNPARKFSANNAGNLSIVAALKDAPEAAAGKGEPLGGAPPVSGKAHLIVTVQRWNTPPIY
ncbi:MAG TPA: quinohemoprotein amine dehydrogenase subunit alpha [Steroidobacteraceae bacterium]|nr:quinohemoprotein amine dehydrogenase subunit alpha [Steroidobacteraceae bacterium]